MSDIDKLAENAKMELKRANNATEFQRKLCEMLIDKYLKPDILAAIQKEPYRIRAIVGTKHGQSFHENGERRDDIQLNKIAYVLEKQVCDFNLYPSFYDEKEPKITTAWNRIAVFDNKADAKFAMKEIVVGEE